MYSAFWIVFFIYLDSCSRICILHRLMNCRETSISDVLTSYSSITFQYYFYVSNMYLPWKISVNTDAAITKEEDYTSIIFSIEILWNRDSLNLYILLSFFLHIYSVSYTYVKIANRWFMIEIIKLFEYNATTNEND